MKKKKTSKQGNLVSESRCSILQTIQVVFWYLPNRVKIPRNTKRNLVEFLSLYLLNRTKIPANIDRNLVGAQSCRHCTVSLPVLPILQHSHSTESPSVHNIHKYKKEKQTQTDSSPDTTTPQAPHKKNVCSFGHCLWGRVARMA